ncbi:flavodoxin [Youxingia wuxianensis]|uniref:Flavodoxin n=1 Tax=Youxingia wuxianensis TaxID=2763678 RepID=A0A926II04_9FIRM|nr:flavodoxin [Youxingia wuxianensis]MBC8585193.1 flavodoxin [Youxingia wuxianensis]
MDKKILVAFFSASGVTAKTAQKLAQAVDADIFEIKPEQAYTSADLNWTDKNSRSSVEMNDPSCRPAIKDRFPNMEQYKVVFVGFPIWWYVAPKIINTFLESYDFTDKKIIPFATSGGSGIGKTNAELEPSCPGAVLMPGRKLDSSVSKQDLKAWAEKLGL